MAPVSVPGISIYRASYFFNSYSECYLPVVRQCFSVWYSPGTQPSTHHWSVGAGPSLGPWFPQCKFCASWFQGHSKCCIYRGWNPVFLICLPKVLVVGRSFFGFLFASCSSGCRLKRQPLCSDAYLIVWRTDFFVLRSSLPRYLLISFYCWVLVTL